MNAIVYTRVSTEEQADKGYSLAAQKGTITGDCTKRDINLLEIFIDDFSAWKGFERPAYIRLKEYLAQNKGKVQYVLFTQWSRFSRDYTEAAIEIKRLKALGVEANAVEQWIDFSVPENLFMLAIYLAAPQVENDRLSQRTKAGMRQALKEGRWLWKAPYGYTNNKLTKLVEVDYEQAAIVRNCFDLMATGVFKAEEVRRRAKEKGLQVHKQGFLNILQNQFYIGKIKLPANKTEPETMIKSLHQAIIDEGVFNAVQSVLQGKRKPYKGHTKDDSLPLVGILYCPKCNKLMTGSASKGNGGHYHYYHCQRKYGCNNNIRADRANTTFVGFLKGFEPKIEVLQLYNAILKDVFKTNEVDRDAEGQRCRDEISNIKGKLEKLVFKNLEGIIDDETYKRTKDLLYQQRNELEVKKGHLENLPDAFDSYVANGFSLVGKLSHYYVNAELNTKKKIIGSIFPEKIYFENDRYRTTKLNQVIELLFNTGAGSIKKDRPNVSGLSTLAPPSGLEPETL